MLPQIGWHDAGVRDSLVEKEIVRFREAMLNPRGAVEQNPHGNMNRGLMVGMRAAAIRWYRDRNAQDFLWYTRHALRFGTALFQVSESDVGEVEIEAYGTRIVLPRVGARSDASHVQWLQVFALSWLLREPEYGHVLVDMGFGVLRPRRGVSVEAYVEPYTRAIAGFHASDPGWRDELARARELAKPEHHRFVRPEVTTATVVPILEALAALDDGDAERFNQHLYDATAGHKRFVTEFFPEERIAYESLIAWLPLGLACRAYDAGLPVEVRSDYLPEWVIRHEFSEGAG